MINEERRNRKQKVSIILGLLILIGIVSGFTFAFFNYTRTGNPNVLELGVYLLFLDKLIPLV